MATRSSSNTVLAFLVGGLIVGLGTVAWALYGGELPGDDPDISIEVPGVGTLEGEVEGN